MLPYRRSFYHDFPSNQNRKNLSPSPPSSSEASNPLCKNASHFLLMYEIFDMMTRILRS